MGWNPFEKKPGEEQRYEGGIRISFGAQGTKWEGTGLLAPVTYALRWLKKKANGKKATTEGKATNPVEDGTSVAQGPADGNTNEKL